MREQQERRGTGKRAASRLTADDWTAAALEAMAAGGLGAVAVEPLAARLGATKGSFYWHFANREALIEAAVLRWEREYTEGVIRHVDAEPDPLARLRLLIGLVLGATAPDRGGAVELAMLATADHPHLAPVLARVTERRVAYTSALFTALGWPVAEARRRGVLAVTAYLGYAQMAHVAPESLPATEPERLRYVDQVVDLLTAPSRPVV
ncbi:TetR family transcriptional regulator [Actinoplanes sp. SE50]|uniref:TetR/AcrR family transcriptional regulator n=1 Tax=unclassified Actinoplanes TaxID=2626549 RepID=UPI00023ECB51|nr:MULTISPECIES: TetR/AcrR family transcriptional regulator [unclassified Actinoplanes]AEV85419.1 Transcriptional regulator [Actinoplanes sp. SE50/110]ATO83814.1 TetR family transcriptional regulator [Actinoplanes sp. SE50]SLM01222.1 TetR family transcriptional regulator [Actinoplanes sp. SE50/110]